MGVTSQDSSQLVFFSDALVDACVEVLHMKLPDEPFASAVAKTRAPRARVRGKVRTTRTGAYDGRGHPKLMDDLQGPSIEQGRQVSGCIGDLRIASRDCEWRANVKASVLKAFCLSTSKVHD